MSDESIVVDHNREPTREEIKSLAAEVKEEILSSNRETLNRKEIGKAIDEFVLRNQDKMDALRRGEDVTTEAAVACINKNLPNDVIEGAFTGEVTDRIESLINSALSYRNRFRRSRKLELVGTEPVIRNRAIGNVRVIIKLRLAQAEENSR